MKKRLLSTDFEAHEDDKYLLIRRSGTASTPAISDIDTITKIVLDNIKRQPKKILINYYFYKVHGNHDAKDIANAIF